MKTILSCQNIGFKYDKRSILEDINLSVNDKDFLILIGPNGGGKSTLIKIILGLLTPSSGCINYPNEEIFNAKSQIGYTPQNVNINMNFPIQVMDIVLMGFLKKNNFRNKINKEEENEAMKIMEELSILNLAYERFSNLSGGQRQKVLLARSLCGDSKLIILDEPTSNIDIQSKDEIFEILKLASKERSIIMISHDESILNEYARNIIFINKNALNYCKGELNNFYNMK